MWRLVIMGAVIFSVLASGCVYLVFFRPLRVLHPEVHLHAGIFAIRDARVFRSPDEPPLEHATVLIRDGRIAGVGADIAVPAEAQAVRCDHCSVAAGFWNSHVHFTEGKWRFADFVSSDTLNPQLADMLTSRGFTTVVDTGSDLRVTVALRRRIESGELQGPKIYTAGSAQYPPHGIPYYLRRDLPRLLQWFMATPETPAAAARLEQRNIDSGADLLKLFTGSYVERGTVLAMPESNAKAAVAVAHAHGQLAFSHPSNLQGVLVALHSGVDVLAHAPDATEGIDSALLQSLVEAHVAMIPTLEMFATTVTTRASYLAPIYAEVREFHALGGRLLFGTDVGYMKRYDTQDEFGALQLSGLDTADILRMLTTAPAAEFGVQDREGRIEPGFIADLVVLGGDPAADIAAFSSVEMTMRGGRIIYRRP